jgi:hypothetical protein
MSVLFERDYGDKLTHHAGRIGPDEMPLQKIAQTVNVSREGITLSARVFWRVLIATGGYAFQRRSLRRIITA